VPWTQGRRQRSRLRSEASARQAPSFARKLRRASTDQRTEVRGQTSETLNCARGEARSPDRLSTLDRSLGRRGAPPSRFVAGEASVGGASSREPHDSAWGKGHRSEDISQRAERERVALAFSHPLCAMLYAPCAMRLLGRRGAPPSRFVAGGASEGGASSREPHDSAWAKGKGHGAERRTVRLACLVKGFFSCVSCDSWARLRSEASAGRAWGRGHRTKVRDIGQSSVESLLLISGSRHSIAIVGVAELRPPVGGGDRGRGELR
jgi:hypothetical protein